MYALAVVILATGAAWWFAAAPDTDADSRITAWQTMVEELLPERFDQVGAGTLALGAGPGAEEQANVTPGMHVVDVVCVGHGEVRVRVGSDGVTTGQAVPCADRPAPVTFTVALETEFAMALDADSEGTVVVRWRLTALPN
jgi:hypothetical protein